MPKGKNKKVAGLMINELGGKIMKEFEGLRAKTYSCLKGNNNEDKVAKGTKSVSQKENSNFKIIKTINVDSPKEDQK